MDIVVPLTSAPTRPNRIGRFLRSLLKDPILLLALCVLVLVLLAAIVPAVLAPYDPNEIGKELLQGPSLAHPFGTDEFGRDILSRIIYGARIELVIGLLGVAIGVLTGVPVGLVAGYRGGLIDTVLMRFQDALLAFPSVLFAILVVAAQGASQRSIILTIGVIYLPRFARLIRGSVMVLKNEDFVTASRASGAGDTRLLARHILPNCFASVMVQITLALAVAVLIEAGLSYLGLGVQPPTATWGTMLKAAQAYPAQAPWYVLAPGLCIFLVVLSLNLVGDAMRDRLDPRLRRMS